MQVAIASNQLISKVVILVDDDIDRGQLMGQNIVQHLFQIVRHRIGHRKLWQVVQQGRIGDAQRIEDCIAMVLKAVLNLRQIVPHTHHRKVKKEQDVLVMAWRRMLTDPGLAE